MASRVWFLAVVLAPLGALSAADLPAAMQRVSKEEAEQWTRLVIPLPRQIAIDRKVLAAGDQVTITLVPEAGLLERSAAAELGEILKKKTGAKIRIGESSRAGAALEILLGACDMDGRLASRPVPGAERLFALPRPSKRIGSCL